MSRRTLKELEDQQEAARQALEASYTKHGSSSPESKRLAEAYVKSTRALERELTEQAKQFMPSFEGYTFEPATTGDLRYHRASFYRLVELAELPDAVRLEAYKTALRRANKTGHICSIKQVKAIYKAYQISGEWVLTEATYYRLVILDNQTGETYKYYSRTTNVQFKFDRRGRTESTK